MLSRRIILLKGNGTISYNYHYELMKRLYEAMTVTNDSKALKLHDEGVIIENKKFKLFNYCLAFDKEVSYNKEGISFNENNCIRLIVSGRNEVLNLIIKGLIKQGSFNLNSSVLKISGFEEDKKFKFNNIMLYKVRTPIVESVYDGVRIEYLNPYDDRYYLALGQNLLRKYEATYGKKYEGELYFDIEDILKVKKKFITKIKEGFVIGYTDFEIYIQAEPDMQRIAYCLGLGQNTSIGMGNVSYITGRKS